MTLKNLLGLSLDAVAPDKAHIGKLMAAAERNIADAKLHGLSTENRFDAAYKAIMQLAMVALNANGYRTMTSKPGHHQTAIQTLSTSVGLAPAKVIVLDALRKQRNLSDYSGDLVPDAAAAECLTSASDKFHPGDLEQPGDLIVCNSDVSRPGIQKSKNRLTCGSLRSSFLG